MERITNARQDGLQPGQFEGRFLVAMPDMESDIFSESVIYVVLHNDEGALGFIVNKPAPMSLEELLAHTELEDEPDLDISEAASHDSVRAGGPVDSNRGFVLHSLDFQIDSTIALTADLGLTATVSILRALASGTGPSQAVVMLGYAGWGPGQLESEIRDNAWLVTKADIPMIFDEANETKHARVLHAFGINAGNFVTEAGRA